MLFEDPENYYNDQRLGNYTVIGKEDNEREDFGSGGGKILWKKGSEVEKEKVKPDETTEEEKDKDDKNKDKKDEFDEWEEGINKGNKDGAWDSEREAWENDNGENG